MFKKNVLRVDNDLVTILRRKVIVNDRYNIEYEFKEHQYFMTPASIERLHKAVSDEMNQRYTPKITLFSGGYEVEW